MSKGFHTDITFIKWLFGSSTAPFRLIDDNKNVASLDLEKFTAHQYALLDAYPGINKNLEEKSKHSLKSTLVNAYKEDDEDEDERRGSNASSNASTNDDLDVIEAQIKDTRLTWSPSSAIDYVVSLAYYSLALKRMKEDASSLWSIPLSLTWGIHSLIDSLRFVGALIFSPVGFVLTFTLKNGFAAARLLGTRIHYDCARLVNWFFGKITENIFLKKIPLTDDAGKILYDIHGNTLYEVQETETGFSHEQVLKYASIDHKKPLPSLEDAWADFNKRFAANWEASIAYFTPVRQKLEPMLTDLFKKAETSPGWAFASILTVLSLVASVAFLDFVAWEVLTRVIEKRPFGTNFFDHIGGGYAEIVAHHVSAWATLSWHNIEIGMQFFIHFLVNKAVVPALNIVFGLDIAHTSAATCRHVGGIFFMTLIPVLGVLGVYKAAMKKAAEKEKTETLIPNKKIVTENHSNISTTAPFVAPSDEPSSYLSTCFSWLGTMCGREQQTKTKNNLADKLHT